MNVEEHIKFAIFSHTKTIKSLQDYVLFNKRFSDVIDQIDKGHNLDCGKWLEGPETVAHHQKTYFENVKRAHNMYHREVARVVACIQSKNSNLARVILQEGEYQLTLSQFTQSLFDFLENVRNEESFKNSKKRQELDNRTGKLK